MTTNTTKLALETAQKNAARMTDERDAAARKLADAKAAAFAEPSTKTRNAFEAARKDLEYASSMLAEATREADERAAAVAAEEREAKLARLDELKQRGVTNESFPSLVSDDVTAIVDLYRQIEQRARVILDKCDRVYADRDEANALVAELGAAADFISQPHEVARNLAQRAVRASVLNALSGGDPVRAWFAMH